jgi:hypothetical protein
MESSCIALLGMSLHEQLASQPPPAEQMAWIFEKFKSTVVLLS